MRLIDADAFRQWLYTLFAGHGTHEDDTKDEEEWNANLAQIITHLDQQPTVKAKQMNNMAKEAIKEIRNMCWAFDIPHPTCPEYREHHEQMQELLKVCDKWLKKLETEKDAWKLVNSGAPNGCVDLMHEACGNHVICPRCDIPEFCAGCGKPMEWKKEGGEAE